MSTPLERRKKTGAAWWIPVIVLIVYPLIIGGFAVQTYMFAMGILPYDTQLMKIITVFSFDGTSIIYAFAETMYPFRCKSIKDWTGRMWVITFILSLLASIIYMFLQSQGQLTAVTGWLHVACIIVILLAFSLAVIFLTIAVRSEISAWIEGRNDFLEDGQASNNNLTVSPQDVARITQELQAVTAQLEEVKRSASDPLLQRLSKQRSIPTNGAASAREKDTF